MRRFFMLMLMCLLFCKCSKVYDVNSLNVDDLDQDTLIRLHDWYVLAPLYPDTSYAILDRINQDLLLQYGSKESAIANMNDFISVGREIADDHPAFKFSKVSMPHHLLDLGNYFEIKPPVGAYLGCCVKSDENVDVVLNMSAYQSAKFWVNGKEVHRVEWKRGRSKFREEYVPVTLKKGLNFLLVKLLVSDVKYNPKQWQLEVDVSGMATAKRLFSSCYGKHFIRNSLVKRNGVLKLYLGPWCSQNIGVKIFEKGSGEIVYCKKMQGDGITGNVVVPFSDGIMEEGFYVCEMFASSHHYRQDFFYGDIGHYYDSLKQKYFSLKGLSAKQKLNMAGLMKRVYIKARRNSSDFDDQVEFWNRIRIPCLWQFKYAIEQFINGNDPKDAFFLRGYYSEYYHGDNYYSAYLPPNFRELGEMPVFICLMETEKAVRDWTNHWRNNVANGLTEMMDLADELGCIVAWTDCGGHIGFGNQSILFNEIIAEMCKEMPVDTNKIYVVGNCASTDLAVNMAGAFPGLVSGCGLVNPLLKSKPLRNKHCRFTMIYAGYDELIDRSSSRSCYDRLVGMDSAATIHRCDYSSHYNNPPDYMKPILLDLLSR